MLSLLDLKCIAKVLPSAQRLALPALGRAAERRPIGKRLRRKKMLENAAESPASGARFVGQPAVMQI